jgi:Family of unknown function (DUF5677)
MIGDDSNEEGGRDPKELVPDAPDPSDAEWEACEASGDFIPIFFEWLRWAGQISLTLATIHPSSSDYAKITAREFHLLTGLMARCSRLILSLIALTHKGEFGEAASIIFRSLNESAIKIMWLCESDTENRAKRMIADGLKVELEFEAEIRKNIKESDGEPAALEARMLKSIHNHFLAAELTRDEVTQIKKLPDMWSILDGIGQSRLQYVIQQKLGSHAVHGTWPSLLADYLTPSENEAFPFQPRDGPVSPHINQYMMGSRMVLRACSAFAGFALTGDGCDAFVALLDDVDDQLMSDYEKAIELTSQAPA